MGRTPRHDGPGEWHHVMNRGIARRTVFENRRDVRFFLSRLARAVRAGWIEVHAYCVMTTQFQLLVHSKDPRLSRTMQRVLNDDVRWFNRGRKRDGPLFRGRFRSQPVDSLEYRRRLVRYIDDNPVLARLVPVPSLFPLLANVSETPSHPGSRARCAGPSPRGYRGSAEQRDGAPRDRPPSTQPRA